jgi:hypothetical protein
MNRAWTVATAIVVAALLSALVGNVRSSDAKAEPTPERKPMLAHNVYFSLNDNSETAKRSLVADCHKYLSGEPGTVFYAAGVLSDIDRPVSDRDYDVALHVIFASREAHDAYATAPKHLEFIAKNKANWKKVRVLDSYVETAK